MTPTLSIEAPQARSTLVVPLAVALKLEGFVGGAVSGLMVMPTVAAGTLGPTPLLAVRLTVYGPAVVHVWLGFWSVELDPSPKSHSQAVGVFVLVSVKPIDRPAVWVVSDPVNDATGGWGGGALARSTTSCGAVVAPDSRLDSRTAVLLIPDMARLSLPVPTRVVTSTLVQLDAPNAPELPTEGPAAGALPAVRPVSVHVVAVPPTV